MRTLVIGAGGVGGYLGARLAQAGADVTIAARGEHGRLLSEAGLEIQGPNGSERVPLRRVVPSAAALDERFDLILLAVKWPELESTCDALHNLIAANGVVVPLLNGLRSEEVVASYVGAQRTIAGVAYMSAGIAAPGAIYVHGNTRYGLAPFRPGQDGELAAISQLFSSAGVPVRTYDDHRRMLWEKMVWNAPFNAICALTQRSSGEAVARAEPLLRAAMSEVIAVATADGVALPPQMIDAMIHVTRSEFPNTEPSMLQDLRRGRPTEVDILQGEVVARGEAHGVPTPVMSTLASLVRARETG
jgi:2-dehydropantoate 2-reductase